MEHKELNDSIDINVAIILLSILRSKTIVNRATYEEVYRYYKEQKKEV